MTFRQSADVIARREGGQTLVFHQKTGWICILNPSSTFLWESCDGRTAEEIVLRIRDEFSTPGECEGDGLLDMVERHLDLMQKGQLLEAFEA